jgi:putative phosphoesterase
VTQRRLPETRTKAMIVGVISDTHGLLRTEAFEALRGSEHIIHAGDIGAPEIIPALRKIAPVTAIRGNVDVQTWALEFAETEVVELAGRSIYVIHDVNRIDLNPKAAGFDAVISGHSHQAKQIVKDGVLYLNPGSAGPRRFKLPTTVARLLIAEDGVTAESIAIC